MVEQQLNDIFNYFPKLSEQQKAQIAALYDLYVDWNSKINVISRKDMDNFYTHHVLHALSIAKFINFKPGTKVLDLGTGGGFPGLPLAIMFPETSFHLLDSTKKKLLVVDEVAASIGLKNVTSHHQRAEEHRGQYDFVTTRAVAKFSSLLNYINRKIKKDSQHGIPNGLIALKGGDISAELKEAQVRHAEILPINSYFDEEYFNTKLLVYIQI